MALRLGEEVLYGDLTNTSHYATHGVIILRGAEPGQETRLILELTGNCGRDLRGKHFRFRPADDSPADAIFRLEDYTGFQDRQIGPTGTMTTQGWVRALPCSVEEFLRRTSLGEPPPTPWKRHLYLEWYGQNGRVLVEMADAVVEQCVREPRDKDDEGDWEILPNLALPPRHMDAPPAGPGITIIRRDGDEAHIETWTPPERPRHETDEASDTAALQRQFDAEAAAIDRALRGEGDTPDTADSDSDAIAEMELMDYCLEHSETRPISSLLGGTEDLPPPENLDDEAVESALKVLLGQMAIFGIALDVCEHFSPRDCYRLLRDKILPEPHAYAELAGTGRVQHLSTYDFCPACEAEGELTNFGFAK
jgi:hypothetical protein